MKGRGAVWLVLIGVGAAVSYFTVSGGDVVKWNDRVVAVYNKYGRAWQSFQLSIAPYLKQKEADPANMDASFAKYEKDVARASAELRAAAPPDDELCRQFHAELTRYAELQEAQLPEVKKILGTMKAANPPKEEDAARAAAAFNELGQKEVALQDAVQARQKAMAAKFKLKMK